jgi:hypothetical protein
MIAAAKMEMATRATLCLLFVPGFAKEAGSPVKESPRLFPLATWSLSSPVLGPLV